MREWGNSCCLIIRQADIGSEQALAPVREPDTFTEGAWDKLTKTKGTFEMTFLAQKKLHFRYNYSFW